MPTTDWRERTAYLDKRTHYVFSLDLNLVIDTDLVSFADGRVRLRAEAADDAQRAKAAAVLLPDLAPPTAAQFQDRSDTYHVLNDELTTTLDGAVHELPLFRVVELHDWLCLEEEGILNLDGRARLQTDDGASISMAYSGVVRLGFDGSNALLTAGNPSGSAQIATRYDVDRPRYRWLTLSQLIGFGSAVVADCDPAAPGKPSKKKVLLLSVDLYSAR